MRLLRSFGARKEIVHLMHIPKTGGTALKMALSQETETTRFRLILHRHDWKLKDLRGNEKVILFVRDPLSRFVSGFYSRQRMGQPSYHVPWTKGEEYAFGKFQHPSDLGEALSSTNIKVHEDAVYAMTHIRHVHSGLSHWLISPEYLQSRIDQILFIGLQPTLNQDFEKLKTLLELPGHLTLPSNDVESHRTPVSLDKNLTSVARENLEVWYKEDIALWEQCLKIQNEKMMLR